MLGPASAASSSWCAVTVPRLCRRCAAVQANHRRSFASSSAQAGPRSGTTRAAAAAIELEIGNGLPEALETYAKSRDNGLRVTPAAYRDLLTKAARHITHYDGPTRPTAPKSLGWSILLAICKDAVNGRQDIEPARLEALLQVSRTYPAILPAIRSELLKQNTLTAAMLEIIALPAVVEENLEHMLLICYQMFQLRMAPDVGLLSTLVRVAGENGQPRLASQIILRTEALGGQISAKDWYTLLVTSAKNRFLDGVEMAWKRLSDDPAFVIEEGLLVEVLNVAGQWGRPGLVKRAFEALSARGIRAEARHVGPVVQALALAGHQRSLLGMIPRLRSSSFKLDLDMLEHLVASMDSAEKINAALQYLRDIHTSQGEVDPLAFHAVLKAAADSGDYHRMRAVQGFAKEIGVHFTVGMYNTLLSACERLRHQELGDIVLAELTASKLAFDATTYQIMINLCLQPQEYENAFYFLERMKADHFKPTYETYRAILRKCFEHGDQRWTIVLEELESMGYKLDRTTLAAIRAAQRASGRAF